MSNITMDDAVAAGDGTLHGAIDYWQEQAALKDLEIMRLREALEDMNNGWKYIRESHGDLYGVGWDRAEKAADKALATPTTYEDLMAWHNEQLGEIVAWKYTRRDGQVTATVNPDFALIVEGDGFEVTPLYARKDK